MPTHAVEGPSQSSARGGVESSSKWVAPITLTRVESPICPPDRHPYSKASLIPLVCEPHGGASQTWLAGVVPSLLNFCPPLSVFHITDTASESWDPSQRQGTTRHPVFGLSPTCYYPILRIYLNSYSTVDSLWRTSPSPTVSEFSTRTHPSQRCRETPKTCHVLVSVPCSLVRLRFSHPVSVPSTTRTPCRVADWLQCATDPPSIPNGIKCLAGLGEAKAQKQSPLVEERGRVGMWRCNAARSADVLHRATPGQEIVYSILRQHRGASSRGLFCVHCGNIIMHRDSLERRRIGSYLVHCLLYLMRRGSQKSGPVRLTRFISERSESCPMSG